MDDVSYRSEMASLDSWSLVGEPTRGPLESEPLGWLPVLLSAPDDDDAPVEYPLGTRTDDAFLSTPGSDDHFLASSLAAFEDLDDGGLAVSSSPPHDDDNDEDEDEDEGGDVDDDDDVPSSAATVPWPTSPGDAVWVPFAQDPRSAVQSQSGGGDARVMWHKGLVVSRESPTTVRVEFDGASVERIATRDCRRWLPAGSLSAVRVVSRDLATLERERDRSESEYEQGDDDDSEVKVHPLKSARGGAASKRARAVLLAEKVPKKRHGRKNGALSEARWAAERGACLDPNMPLERPVGISLASGSSSGWRLRISGTQLGHYATAQQAWEAYPCNARARAASTLTESTVGPDDDEPASPRGFTDDEYDDANLR